LPASLESGDVFFSEKEKTPTDQPMLLAAEESLPRSWMFRLTGSIVVLDCVVDLIFRDTVPLPTLMVTLAMVNMIGELLVRLAHGGNDADT